MLVYLAPEEGAALVRCLGRLLRCAAFVVYEQIRPHDPFGQQMVLNLQACSKAPPLVASMVLQTATSLLWLALLKDSEYSNMAT